MESLVSLTELSEEEEKTRKINLDRREELEHMTAAYQYLLQHCAPRLDPKVVDLNSIVEKVIFHMYLTVIHVYYRLWLPVKLMEYQKRF